MRVRGRRGPAAEQRRRGGRRRRRSARARAPEVFSDDGTFGTELPDSYRTWPHEVLLERSEAAFDSTCAEALELLAARERV
jgi:hypothetical protein